MKIGIIAGEDFFKTSSFYIAQLAVEQISKENPETQFYIFDKSAGAEKVFLPPGVQRVPVPQMLKGVLKPGLLQKQRLVAQMKKHEIRKLWVFDPAHIIKTNLHQTLVLNNEHSVEADTLQNIEKCNRIITFSATHLQKLFHLSPSLENILVATDPVVQQSFQPLSFDERLSAKEKFADNKEYFVSADFEMTKEQFLNLLKAFSGFKKMQQSNWKLIIYLRSQLSVKEKEEILQPLSSFKFRNDVVIGNSRSEGDLTECVAGAYALINVSEKSLFPLPVIEGLLCHVPVVTLKSADVDKYANALVITNESSAEFLANKMMALYKDENLRNWLSKKSAEVIEGFDAEENIKKLANLLA